MKDLRKIVNEHSFSSFASQKLNRYFWSWEVGEVRGWREETERSWMWGAVGLIFYFHAPSLAGEGDKGILFSFKSGGPRVKEVTATFGFLFLFLCFALGDACSHKSFCEPRQRVKPETAAHSTLDRWVWVYPPLSPLWVQWNVEIVRCFPCW